MARALQAQLWVRDAGLVLRDALTWAEASCGLWKHYVRATSCARGRAHSFHQFRGQRVLVVCAAQLSRLALNDYLKVLLAHLLCPTIF